MELRGHHLLCLPMYQGRGYSEGFCSHMTEVIAAIRETGEPIRVMVSPDEVCSCCPHLQPEEQKLKDLPETKPEEQKLKDLPEIQPKERKLKDLPKTQSERADLKGRSCDHEDRTAKKDGGLLAEFGLTPGETYTRERLKSAVLSGMNEEVFLKYCGKCQWREEGLCSYELWKTKFTELF